MNDKPAARGLFGRLYGWMLGASSHRHAPVWLAVIAFAESSFFPLPPDLMLAPMSLAQPRRAFGFAALCTAASVVGGVAGYAIGYYLIDAVLPLIQRFGYQHAYDTIQMLYARYGFWAVVIKGLTPLPYKIFTISAGAAHMPLLSFVSASCISRGMRFFLVAGALKWGGPAAEARLLRYIEWIGWALIVLIAGAVLWATLR